MLVLAEISNDVIPIIALGGGMVVAVIAIVSGTVSQIVRTRSREATKREIAAYVAEGTISPDDAEKIIQADRPHWERK